MELLSKNQIYKLQEVAGNNVERILDHFGVETVRAGKCLMACCPIHKGDNETALSVYPYGHTIGGYWKCRTYGCHEVFKTSIIGLVRGLLSAKNGWIQRGDRIYPFNDTLSYVQNILSCKQFSDDEIDISIEKGKFSRAINRITEETPSHKIKIPREAALNSLSIPSEYFLNRGISKETLVKYDIGTCRKKGKHMFERAVIPVYNDSGEYIVGCVGRSIHDECDKCNLYHDIFIDCPDKQNAMRYRKWLNSPGFAGESTLFNYWFAKEHIKKTSKVILVEGPLDCIKMVDMGYLNTVALFGDCLTEKQQILLEKSGVFDIIILTDNDKAGQNAAITINKQCQRLFNIIMPKYPEGCGAKDVVEMSKEDVKCMLSPT